MSKKSIQLATSRVLRSNEITEAIRRQLHAKYDDGEVKQSWLILTESDPMLLVAFSACCHICPAARPTPSRAPFWNPMPAA
jgi:hypothetical protein